MVLKTTINNKCFDRVKSNRKSLKHFELFSVIDHPIRSLDVLLPNQTLAAVNDGSEPVDFISLTKGWLGRVCQLLGVEAGKIREGELAAFLSYAIAYPHNFLPVIDSYSVSWYERFTSFMKT